MFRLATTLTLAPFTAVLLALMEPAVAASGLGKTLFIGVFLAIFRSPLWMTGYFREREGRT